MDMTKEDIKEIFISLLYILGGFYAFCYLIYIVVEVYLYG